MHPVELVFVVGWAAFWIYWLVSAFSMKRGRIPWSRELRVRVVIIVAILILVRLRVFRHGGIEKEVWLHAVGVVLFVLGLALAVWARRTIGRNWGMPMTERDDPELVTTGPYRLVRHPIYSGILLGIAGTAIALSWVWLVVVALVAVYFGYSAIHEERFLVTAFPETYPEYQRTTKRILPFIW